MLMSTCFVSAAIVLFQLCLQFSNWFNSLLIGCLLITFAPSFCYSLIQAYHPRQVYTLMGGSGSEDGYFISVQLLNTDVDALKLFQGLADTERDTFISVRAGGIRDTSMNPTLGISINASLPVTTLIKDQTPPTLSSFVLDMNAGEINITFSELVLTDSIDPTQFQLVDSTTPSLRFTLPASTALGPNSKSYILNLTDAFVDSVKVHVPGIAYDENSTYLVVIGPGAADLNGYDIRAISDSKAIPADEVVRDSVPPELISFNVDLAVSTLTLVFDDVVNPANIFGELLTFQNDASSPTINYTLTSTNESITTIPAKTVEIKVCVCVCVCV